MTRGSGHISQDSRACAFRREISGTLIEWMLPRFSEPPEKGIAGSLAAYDE